jgi:hypothetical protein
MLIESLRISYISSYPASSFEFWGTLIEISDTKMGNSFIAIGSGEEHGIW